MIPVQKEKRKSIRQQLFLGTIVCCLCSSAMAQVNWPAVTGETKPWARWWWQGSAVNKADLAASLEAYKAAGLGGLEITPIYGVKGAEEQFVSFLSPQWMELLQYTLVEAKRLGLGIDMANGTGWPFGGPWIREDHASKTVHHRFYTLKGGESLDQTVVLQQEGFVRTANAKTVTEGSLQKNISANKDLQGLALDQVRFSGPLPLRLLMGYSASGTALDLTSKVEASGRLNWVAPEGVWNLVALFEGLHGKMVERAAPGGEGYAIDHFSAPALQHYLERFDAAFRGKDLSSIRALFNDSYEVDDARGQSNWTPALFAEFRNRRGYDLRYHLQALFGQGALEESSRVLYDYRATIDELILEHFTRAWKKWGASKGALIRNQSHGSPANLLDLYGAIDIPETEGNNILRFKFATSAAHVLGKKLASAEAATWLNEHFLSSWSDVKKVLDLFFLGGVNHIFYHGVNYSPRGEAWPGWLFYAAVHFNEANPQWKDFGALNAYVTRVQSFLQGGQHDNDVLVYYPLADRYMDRGKELLQHFDGMERQFEGTDFEHASEWLLKEGYQFDFFSDRQLLGFTPTARGVRTGGGTYKTILLPANRYIPEASFQKLVALARSGVQVLVYKNLPSEVPGYARLKERQGMLDGLKKKLSFSGEASLRKAAVGTGAFWISDDLSTLLSIPGVRREESSARGLSVTRRKNSNGTVYFLSHAGNQPYSGWVTLNSPALAVALFDAMTGACGLAQWRRGKDNTTEVYVQLPPAASLLVQTYHTRKAGTLFPYLEKAGPDLAVEGTWELAFVSGGPELPPVRRINSLRSWTEEEGEAVKNFSGTARYRIKVPKPSGPATAYLLDLGHVDETAEVFLNGKKKATLIGPAFHLEIPARDWKEENELEILVSNLMANRIRYMDQQGIAWKKFYNINMSARFKENLKNGVFDAALWKPQSSGLLGPVTITPLRAFTRKE